MNIETDLFSEEKEICISCGKEFPADEAEYGGDGSAICRQCLGDNE
jgi:formylmethanofuran dehydrogenase subunit E